ncbi:MAG TPA: glutamate--tRNA ligase [Dictyoglomaceae bacterium]|nr:glutamate--tRNA ligase [Dictyoglomaceae bacterium]HOL38886.1 glutamate--tRNA ligase [Dictyoglomaceae bacterium]HPP15697.1 glutamate--tRNA ligase [Dictyoglomaceae bacterium]
MNSIRVRIAPSPTGYLHVGTAHTALFNWLFARHNKGKFILRIEDTDILRSSKEYEENILEGLKWLGLVWDEGPYYQTQRLDLYKKYADELLRIGAAYYCYCTPEELEERRKEALAQKKPPKYDRKCLYLTDEERTRYEREGRKPVIRLLVPEGKTVFSDIIRGDIEFNNEDIGDFVIMKSDRIPTYNFAVVVDDYTMGITHVIRGEDHISNTPKQLFIYNALGWNPPEFAHLPLLLGPDRSKLSKRHGETSITEYRKMGYLPEALVNYLALLGWTPEENREIYTIEELIELFDIHKVTKNPGIFDITKLDWINTQHIRRLSVEKLAELTLPFLEETEWFKKENLERNYYLKVVSILQERLKTLSQIKEYADYFFLEDLDYDLETVKKVCKHLDTHIYLQKIKEEWEKLEEFTAQNLESSLRSLAESMQIPTKNLIHPIRVALTNKTVGPSLYELVEILGKDRVTKRLEKFIEFLKNI